MVDVLAAMSTGLARGSDTPATITTAGGGSAANVAAWLAGQGVPTSYVGRVGDDALGRESVAGLTDRGVTAWVSIDPELTTGTCIVLVEPGGERSMLPDAGANGTLTPDHVPQRPFRPGGHLHLSGYTLLNPGSRDAGLAALSLAAAADMTVSLDPSSAALLEQVGAGPVPRDDPRRRPAAGQPGRGGDPRRHRRPAPGRRAARRHLPRGRRQGRSQRRPVAAGLHHRQRTGRAQRRRRRHHRGGRRVRRRLPRVLAAAPRAGDRAGCRQPARGHARSARSARGRDR